MTIWTSPIFLKNLEPRDIVLILFIIYIVFCGIYRFFKNKNIRNHIFPSIQASGNYNVAVIIAIARFIISELLTGLEEWTKYTPKVRVAKIWFSAFWLYNLWCYQYITSKIIISQVSLFLLQLNWISYVSLDSDQYIKKACFFE